MTLKIIHMFVHLSHIFCPVFPQESVFSGHFSPCFLYFFIISGRFLAVLPNDC